MEEGKEKSSKKKLSRRRFLVCGAVGGMGLAVFPGICLSGGRQVQEEGLLEQAQENIERCRKGVFRIRLEDREGKPIRRVRIWCRQLQHHFLFGCNGFGIGTIEDPCLEERYQEQFVRLWNLAVLRAYWAYLQLNPETESWQRLDRPLQWCRQQGIQVMGAPLVWANEDPPWLPENYDRIREYSVEHVRRVVSRYRGRIPYWVVVNEPVDIGRFSTRLGRWAKAIGRIPYVVLHLRAAREADPKAVLLINDYHTDTSYLRLIGEILTLDPSLLDGVGIQLHMHGGEWPLRTVWEVCERFSQLGLPIYFTEVTVLSDDRFQRWALVPERWGPTSPSGERIQARYVGRLYQLLFGHPAVRGVIWWDFSDAGAWLGAPAGLLRKDMKPKPAYRKLYHLIRRRWWTKAELITDREGWALWEGFYGKYEVEVRLSDGWRVTRRIEWTPEGAREVRWRLNWAVRKKR